MDNFDDIPVEFEDKQSEVADVATSTAPETTQELPAENSDKQTESKEADTFTEEGKKSEPEKTSEEDKSSPDKSKFDEDLDTWAEKKGHEKPENDRERKLLQNLRDSDRQFTRDQEAKKAASQVEDGVKTEQKAIGEKNIEPKDELDKRLNPLEIRFKTEQTARLRSEFFTTNNISDATSQVMVDILKEKVALEQTPEEKQAVIDYWDDPKHLHDWYELAKAREINAVGKDEVVDEATKKERERIAQLGKAGGVNRSAKSTVPQGIESDLDKLWKD